MGFVEDMIDKERYRQKENIELIASENFVSDRILQAMGSCLTNKYSEGYPSRRASGNRGRYYGGCQWVDEIEEYACDMWRRAFHTNYHVNVQPHSGSNANMAAYMAAMGKNRDMSILALDLNSGGHLTHGSSVNFSGKQYRTFFYDLTPEGWIDYDDMRNKACKYRPSIILAGASAYSREINFRIFREVADEVGALLMVDMAHIAGLVAAGYHISPFECGADIITTTTHKTLRGPRGGMIFCRNELAHSIDSAVFPGVQGGPLQHIIAAKAICAEEVALPEFRDYIGQVVKNAKAMAEEFLDLGYAVVTGGTDNHMFLLDLTKEGITGLQVQETLDRYGITLNKNCVPGEQRSPKEASGVRIGTAAMTTKGYDEEDFREVARKIDSILRKENLI